MKAKVAVIVGTFFLFQLIETCEKKKKMEYYRADGVRITHDPYHPSMAEKYGLPGETDR